MVKLFVKGDLKQDFWSVAVGVGVGLGVASGVLSLAPTILGSAALAYGVKALGLYGSYIIGRYAAKGCAYETQGGKVLVADHIEGGDHINVHYSFVNENGSNYTMDDIKINSTP